ncbi:MAG: bifunctional aminoglycoside phosphotransferase/ATP-binding protein [Solirubrobacteraceae bacterium]
MSAGARAVDSPHSSAVEGLLEALGDPATYGDGCTEVVRHETHGSWVFLAGDRAVKVKKPVVLPFLDYGTRERRGEMCREEVHVNRRLAPDLYLGTVGLVPRPDGTVAFDPDDEAFEAVEPAVLMRRYDEADTLAARQTAGRATPAQLAAAGARLAAFHAVQARPSEAAAALAALRAAVRTTIDDLETASAVVAQAPAITRQLRGVLEAGLSARRDELLERGRRGLVVDGHGDLRAEHVLLTDPVQVVDALEFDPALRLADVACDLGFLVMDLEGRAARDLAAALVTGYRDAGGDPGDDSLLALMACYRALVRAKVDVVRARQGEPEGAGRARARLVQAAQLGWRARGPQLLAVCGPPATGKSTLARALCAQGDMVRVSSDRVRKAHVGVAATAPAPPAAYAPGATIEVYRTLGEHAAAALATGRGAVIDATLGDPEARAALRAGLGRAAPLLRFVECRVPTAEAQRRAAERERVGPGESDAGAVIAARLAAGWAPLDEVAAERHLVLRADRPSPGMVADVSAWLDRAWS